MSVLTINPNHGAYNVSPTAHITVLGSVVGEVFNHALLQVIVDGESAVYAGTAVRPSYSWTFNGTDTHFVLTLTPRRAFLYRVKVKVEVVAKTNMGTHSAEAEFEIRAPGTALVLGAARHALDRDFRVPSSVTLNAVSQQLYSLLGGESNGAFAVRLLRRVQVSHLWSAARAVFGNESLRNNVVIALENLSPNDAAVRGNIQGTLEMTNIFWEPALQQLIELGMSPAYAEMLNRSFHSDNDLDKLGAASLAVMLGSVAEADTETFRRSFDTDRL